MKTRPIQLIALGTVMLIFAGLMLAGTIDVLVNDDHPVPLRIVYGAIFLGVTVIAALIGMVLFDRSKL